MKTLNRPIHTISVFSASMGFQIVQNLDQRLVLQNAVLMSHEAYGGFEGSFSHGQSQIDSIYGLWLTRMKELDLVTVKRTNGKQTLDSYRKAYSKDLWLTANQAVKLGYADEIVKARCDTTMNGVRSEIIYFMNVPIRVDFSECPVITAPLAIEIMINTNKGLMSLREFNQKGGLVDYIPDYYDGGNQRKTDVLYATEKVDIKELLKKLEEYKKERMVNEKKVIRN